MDNQIPYNQPTSFPTPKVTAGGLGGALTIVLVFVLGEFGVTVPPEVASALTTIVSVGAAYFTRDKKPVEIVKAIKEDENLRKG